MPKIGRNDPCPCGSGKKYKFCCGSTEAKILPFPGTELEPPEPITIESGGMTMAELQGTPNMATAAIHEMEAALTGQSFASQEELEDALAQFVETRQNRGLEDFLGLSPAQMHRILYAGPEGNAEIFELQGPLTESDVPSVPLLDIALFLLKRLVESDGLKATAKGNLPRALTQELWNRMYAREDEQLKDIFKPQREDDFLILKDIRTMLQREKYIKRSNGKFQATTKSKKLIESGDFTILYQEVFETIAWKMDWNENRDDYRFMPPYCQETFVFTLYLFGKLARNWLSREALVEAYLRAFPHLNTPEENQVYSQEAMREVLNIQLGNWLTHFPLQLGLIEATGDEWSLKKERNPEYRVTPLFDRLLKWFV